MLILILLLLLGTNLIPVTLGGGSDAETNPARLARYGYIAIYLIAILMLTIRIKTLAIFLNTAPLLALILLLPFLSMLWSQNPIESFERGVAVLCPSLIGIYMAERFDLRSIILILASAYAVIAVMDLFAAVALPNIGRMTEQEWNGAWRGFHGHKTSLGKTAFIGIIFSLYALLLTHGKARSLFLAIIALQVVLLLQARSTAALIGIAISLACMFWLITMKQKRQAPCWIVSMAALFLFCMLALFVIDQGMAPILELLGKNQTMSSRLPLWKEVMVSIAKTPLLGYGFSAFWQSDLPDVQRIQSVLRFEPHYAHNGLLEMMLDGGLLFVVLFTAQLVSSIAKATVLFWRSAFYASLPLIFMFIFILSNFAEASVLPKNSLFWVVFVTLASLTARSVRFINGRHTVPLAHRHSACSA